MNKKLNRILGKIFILGTAFMWFSCDSESVSSPSSEPVPSSSSNPAPSSSETSAPTSSSETPVPNSSSETPASSSSGASKAFINIEEELLKLKRPDTTGLRGTCTTEYDACMRSILSDRYSEYVSYIGRSGNIDASFIAEKKINEFLESPNGASLSENIKNCYKGATYLINTGALDYGVVPCHASIEIEKEIGKNDSCEVTIDDSYINNLLKEDENHRLDFQDALKKVNDEIARCNSLE
ncbi:MAG: hypothetical protein J5615_10350 [Fibrobacter sp.]|nr:hypothetical protein [Fibrobacter sp.]